MAELGCKTCAFRKKYDDDPNSLLGRFWRWHAKWCPGWKAYLRSLPPEESAAIRERYGMNPGHRN